MLATFEWRLKVATDPLQPLLLILLLESMAVPAANNDRALNLEMAWSRYIHRLLQHV